MSIKVLIADNSKTMRNIIKNQLNTIDGIGEIDEASDGFVVLTNINTKHYDLVILDVHMAGRSGMELLPKIIKKDNTCVILTTTDSDKKNIDSAKKIGVTNFLFKPFTPKKLHECFGGIVTTLSLFKKNEDS